MSGMFRLILKSLVTLMLPVLLFLTGGVSGEGRVYVADVDEDGVQRVDITGGTHFFDPDYIRVKVDIPVELRVVKEKGIIPHNIVMDEPDAGIEFRKNLTTEPEFIRFTPRKTGAFPYYCDKRLLFFRSHREKGMKGTIEVVN